MVVSIFIYWEAKGKEKIYKYNYEATKLAIKRAFSREPSVGEVLERKMRRSILPIIFFYSFFQFLIIQRSASFQNILCQQFSDTKYNYCVTYLRILDLPRIIK